ncbi:MAG: MFS transporter [Xanthobacteraceae bacterium]
MNFFIAGALAGFGPFVAVFLANRGWRPTDIGFVLSAGAMAALVAQLPGGELIDVIRSKRLLVAVGSVMVAATAVIIALRPDLPMVLVALMVQGIAGGLIGPAIAAMSLGLVGHALLAERLGRNQSFKSAGSLLAAALMGLVGDFLSDRAIFFTSAALALPTLLALKCIDASGIHFGRSVGAPDHHAPTKPPRIPLRALSQRRHLMIFAGCLFLFQLADAAILPLTGATFGKIAGGGSVLFMSGFLVVPQLLVVLFAPWVGRSAQRFGRRPLLLAGFAVLPVRALLFVLISNPVLLTAVQLLDGISATVLGVLTPLVIADVTMGTGRFNLAQGFVGVVSGFGAVASTAVAGVIAQRFGPMAGFLEILTAAVAAAVDVWLFMPETRPSSHAPNATRAVRLSENRATTGPRTRPSYQTRLRYELHRMNVRAIKLFQQLATASRSWANRARSHRFR